MNKNKKKILVGVVLALIGGFILVSSVLAGGCMYPAQCAQDQYYCYPQNDELSQVCAVNQPGSAAGFYINDWNQPVACEGHDELIPVALCKLERLRVQYNTERAR